MKWFTVAVVVQLVLVTTGHDLPRESKRVGCWYLGRNSERYGTQNPNDVSTSLCSHLVILKGEIVDETEEIREETKGDDGLLPKLAKLKDKNPSLKMILFVNDTDVREVLYSSRVPKFIRNGVKWLNESGFDGLHVHFFIEPPNTEVANMFCDLKSELNKHGFILETTISKESLPGLSREQEKAFTKLVGCCDHVTLATGARMEAVNRVESLDSIKIAVDMMNESGFPSKKIQIFVQGYGMAFMLQDLNNTEPGANASGPGNDDKSLGWGYAIHYKELRRKLNDSSLGWTFRRDNETMEPYAFSTTKLWVSYEDAASVEMKTRYVMDKGLGGIDVVALEFEDEDGRFPFTRTIDNTFRRAYQTAKPSN